jgi:hypothetical protein
MELEAAKIFSSAFSVAFEAQGRELAFWRAERPDCSWASLTLFLIFCKRLPSKPFPFRTPQSKSSSI